MPSRHSKPEHRYQVPKPELGNQRKPELGNQRRLDFVINGGQVPGKPSSVVSLWDDVPEIIREGLGDVSIL